MQIANQFDKVFSVIKVYFLKRKYGAQLCKTHCLDTKLLWVVAKEFVCSCQGVFGGC